MEVILNLKKPTSRVSLWRDLERISAAEVTGSGRRGTTSLSQPVVMTGGGGSSCHMVLLHAAILGVRWH